MDDGPGPEFDLELRGLTLTGGDVGGSSPDDSGGAIFNRENLTVTGRTISGSFASIDGNEITRLTGTVNLDAYNLIGDKSQTTSQAISGSVSTGTTDILATSVGDSPTALDLILGPLADNGGPTFTHALVSSGPAIDAGAPDAVAGVDDVPRFDQRGEGYDRVQYGRIDIGAVEMVFSPADINRDGAVDGADAAVLFLLWGAESPDGDIGDINHDGSVDAADAGVLLANWANREKQT